MQLGYVCQGRLKGLLGLKRLRGSSSILKEETDLKRNVRKFLHSDQLTFFQMSSV